MKLLPIILLIAILSTPVHGALIADIGNSFRRMMSDSNFTYFLFYILIFIVLFAVFNAAGNFIPMFKDNAKNRKVFAVTMALLITTVMFVNWRGNLLDTLSNSLGPYGKSALLLIGLVVLFFLLIALFRKVGGGEGTSSVGGVFKWILIGLLVILGLYVLSAMVGGGSGFGIGGNIGDWIALALGLLLLGLLIYFIFQGVKTAGGGGVGSGGDSGSGGPGFFSKLGNWLGDKVFGKKEDGEKSGLLSKLNPFNLFKAKTPEEKAALEAKKTAIREEKQNNRDLKQKSAIGNLKAEMVEE